jgi:hypothetical protein
MMVWLSGSVAAEDVAPVADAVSLASSDAVCRGWPRPCRAERFLIGVPQPWTLRAATQIGMPISLSVSGRDDPCPTT